MSKVLRKLVLLSTAVITVLASAMPALAYTSKYGEDKPLRTVGSRYYIETDHGRHKHYIIETSNGIEYLFYDHCMDGMIGTVPTNHEGTLTIDGERYTLRNYSEPDGFPGYANVIKRIGGSSASKSGKIALKKISLNKTSLTLKAGSSASLTVVYIPANTTVKRTVTWTSSNSRIASVSGGRVKAKKAGTVTIKAKVGTKTASCKVTVKAAASKKQGAAKDNHYLNVTGAYKVLNKFRTTKSNQWYWNSSNTKKIKTYGLKALKRSAALENVAKKRAKEQWIMGFERKDYTHTRPNGTSWFTIYPANLSHMGENLTWGNLTYKEVITDPVRGWAETSFYYGGQPHRRSMLSKQFTKVGIACYKKDGKMCWAMCLGG